MIVVCHSHSTREGGTTGFTLFWSNWKCNTYKKKHFRMKINQVRVLTQLIFRPESYTFNGIVSYDGKLVQELEKTLKWN